jgi:hypothetical protein
MKFSVCNEIFRDWDLREVFRAARKMGYDAVEIAPFTLADSVEEISRPERAHIRAMAAEEGIALSAIHWVLVKPEGLYIKHPRQGDSEKTSSILSSWSISAPISGKAIVWARPISGGDGECQL